MARKVPLIAPGSVLAAREVEPVTESVLEDVIGTHRRRKGIDPPIEEPLVDVAEPESKIVRKSENQKERKIEDKQESPKEIIQTNNQESLIEQAVECSLKPGGELTPWGTRLPRGLKKRLDYQAFRLKDQKVSGQGLTILALELLLVQLEAEEVEE